MVFSKIFKHKVKNAVKYIGDYEKTLANYAKRKKFDGIICGHIHHSADQILDGVRYLNCGDWVEGATFLVNILMVVWKSSDWDKIEEKLLN